jgi:hypothetical protein
VLQHGEWWRLLSLTFLHAGFMHVAFNAFVLYLLGSLLERLVGTARFLLLYGASALGGSLVSLVFLGDRFGVGASGALWGVLVAEAIIAFRRTDLLPTLMVPQMRKAAVINLGINVLNSFRPGVDWAAHFGGGAVGGLWVVAGLLTWTPAPGTTGTARLRTPAVVRGAALVTAAALLGSLVLALQQGRPWEPGRAPTFARRTLPELGISAVLPVDLEPGPVHAGEDVLQQNLGRARMDPFLLSFVVGRFPGRDDADLRHRVLVRAAETERVRPGLRFDRGPEVTRLPDGMEAMRASMSAENGTARFEVVYVAQGWGDVRLEAACFVPYCELYESTAIDIMTSVEPAGEGGVTTD